MKRPSYGFGVPAYNEHQTIQLVLNRLKAVRWRGDPPKKIVVVSDCSSDGTDEIVTSLALDEKEVPILLKRMPARSGKPAAINLAMKELADCEFVGMVSADCLPKEGALETLLDCFNNPEVGVSAGRIVTCGNTDRLSVRISKILWDVHHEIALVAPKSSEISLLRNISVTVNPTIADEADLEASVVARGFRINYSPNAVIYNQAPSNLSDYFFQRLRVTFGYFELAQRTGFSVGTLKMSHRFRSIIKVFKRGEHKLIDIAAGVFLEVFIYLCAVFQAKVLRKNMSGIWKPSTSAKRPFQDDLKPKRHQT